MHQFTLPGQNGHFDKLRLGKWLNFLSKHSQYCPIKICKHFLTLVVAYIDSFYNQTIVFKKTNFSKSNI